MVNACKPSRISKVTSESLECLRPGNWINDQIINHFVRAFMQRSKRKSILFLESTFSAMHIERDCVVGMENAMIFGSMRAVSRS